MTESSNKKRIFFVDDDKAVLDGLRRMLHNMRNEWDMNFVTSGKEALEVMENEVFDVVVSDLRMSEMDGVSFFEQVRKKYPETIRFMLSGYSDQPLQGRAARCVHQFISKPCDATRLKDLISRAFALQQRLSSGRTAKVLSKIRSLPVMPEMYQKLIDVLSNPRCSARQVGRLISLDIGMSSKILQVVNSAFYGHGKQIADPVQAVVYLGLKTVEALVLTSGIFSTLDESKIEQFSVTGLQEHCTRVGMLARAICKTEGMVGQELDVAAMAGILHDSGKMIMLSRFSEDFTKAIKTSRAMQIPLCEAERGALSVSHAELGGCLLDLWGLPNDIIEAVTYHHEPWHCINTEFSISTAVYAANAIDHYLCCGIGDGWFEGEDVGYLERIGVCDRWSKWQKLHLPIETQEYEYV
ncbi:MAG: HDOD domain-containing protein [Planctomycetes bacterium]|nr:HDOD domain-containing protein [Planctomycetota bacterium]